MGGDGVPLDGRMIARHLHRLIPSPYETGLNGPYRWSMMVPNMNGFIHYKTTHGPLVFNAIGGRDPAALHQVQLEDGTWGPYEEDVACRWI